MDMAQCSRYDMVRAWTTCPGEKGVSGKELVSGEGEPMVSSKTVALVLGAVVPDNPRDLRGGR
jgi:hypothetical protein